MACWVGCRRRRQALDHPPQHQRRQRAVPHSAEPRQIASEATYTASPKKAPIAGHGITMTMAIM
jgi:hypothetical protein